MAVKQRGPHLALGWVRPAFYFINMITEKIFTINPDGRIQRVSIVVDDLTMNNDILSRFATENPVKLPNLIASGVLGSGAIGNIGVSCRLKSFTFTIPVGVLPMRAAFSIKDGILMPDFTAAKPELMDLKWEVITGMRVFLLVYCPVDSKTIWCENQFLVAYDAAGRMYRLPVSNVYEDCRLCTGSYSSEGSTYMDVLCKAWNQFTMSNWQKDLVDRGGDNAISNAQAMFRYKPNEKSGFEQLPPAASDWTGFCKKINNEFINTNIIL